MSTAPAATTIDRPLPSTAALVVIQDRYAFAWDGGSLFEVLSWAPADPEFPGSNAEWLTVGDGLVFPERQDLDDEVLATMADPTPAEAVAAIARSDYFQGAATA